MRVRIVIALICLVLIAGCTNSGERRKQLGTLVLAVAGEEVFAGRAVIYAADGTFRLQSLITRDLSCRGRFTFRARRAKFTCSDGSEGKIRLYLNEGVFGEGFGTSSFGAMSLVYGHRIDQANAALPLPEGLRLVVVDGEIRLAYVQPEPKAPNQINLVDSVCLQLAVSGHCQSTYRSC